MIKQSLMAAGVFLALDAAFVHLGPSGRPMAQHQWQDNLIKAERFVYGTGDEKEDVLVGTSLSGRLVMEKLPDIFNLGLGGLGILDGLDVLLQSQRRPRIVYIEMNMVLRERHAEFIASLNQPVLFHLRKWFPSMRDENQPVAMMMKTLRGSGMRFGSQAEVQEAHGEESIFTKMLAIHMADYVKIPRRALLDEQFNQLKTDVRALEKRSAAVVFFEMPVNEQLSELPRMRKIREYFHNYFPPKDYKYIARPDSGQYLTTDGEHLGHLEALRYTEYFKSMIAKNVLITSSNQNQSAKRESP
jgi:hypothetical protein